MSNRRNQSATDNSGSKTRSLMARLTVNICAISVIRSLQKFDRGDRKKSKILKSDTYDLSLLSLSLSPREGGEAGRKQEGRKWNVRDLVQMGRKEENVEKKRERKLADRDHLLRARSATRKSQDNPREKRDPEE